MSIEPGKITPWIGVVMIAAIGVAYFVFLYASWHQFQQDRVARESKIDDILSRIPKPATE